MRPAPGDVVVIVHGPATPIVVNNAAYVKRTGIATNPNIALVAALKRAGASVRVCSQALAGNAFAPGDVTPGIEIDRSALITLSNLQLRGWALIPD